MEKSSLSNVCKFKFLCAFIYKIKESLSSTNPRGPSPVPYHAGTPNQGRTTKVPRTRTDRFMNASRVCLYACVGGGGSTALAKISYREL